MRPEILQALPDWFPGDLLVPRGGTIHLIALIATLLIALRLVQRAGLDTWVAYWTAVWGIAGAILGGRLWIIWLDPEPMIASGLDLIQGEKAVIGAAAGASIAAASYLLATRRPVLAYADAMIPAVFCGYAFARLGCFLGGCCFGSLTQLPWGIHYPPGSAAYLLHRANGWIATGAQQSLSVHPAPLYHLLMGLTLCIATRMAWGVPGRPLAIGLAGYGVARFAVEFFRGDSVPLLLGLDANHLASLALIAAGFLFWLWIALSYRSGKNLREAS